MPFAKEKKERKKQETSQKKKSNIQNDANGQTRVEVLLTMTFFLNPRDVQNEDTCSSGNEDSFQSRARYQTTQ